MSHRPLHRVAGTIWETCNTGRRYRELEEQHITSALTKYRYPYWTFITVMKQMLTSKEYLTKSREEVKDKNKG